MAKPYKFLCDDCKRSQSNRPGYTVCQRCKDDHRAMYLLGDLIRRARPQHERTPTHLLLARFWEVFAQAHHPEHADAAKKLVAQLQRGEQLELHR